MAPLLGEEGAAELYRAFLDDTVGVVRRVPVGEREIWVPRDGRRGRDARARWMARRYPDLGLRWQEGASLGERLAHAFETAFGEGVERAAIVGSDHPTLPARHLERAFRRLRRTPVVLGPTRDGGYYTVALRRDVWPRSASLFEGVPWSTAELLEVTLRRVRELGLEVELLPEWYDVDEPRDLERLRRDVAAGSRTARALARLAPEDRGRERSTSEAGARGSTP